MLSALKRSAVLVGCALVGMQFIPASTKPNTASEKGQHVQEMANPQVVTIMNRACEDCHSRNTHWPWYGHVAPVSWILARDVNRGRAKLDLSEWTGRTPSLNERQEICDAVSDGSMPLLAYRFLHPNAALSKRDVDLICDWADAPRRDEGRTQANASTMTDSQIRFNSTHTPNRERSR